SRVNSVMVARPNLHCPPPIAHEQPCRRPAPPVRRPWTSGIPAPICCFAMHRAARLSAILERLADGGSVAVADLADVLDASPATIRRDLVILEQQRLLARTHGGATAHAVSYELPLRYKGVRDAEEKRGIAPQAAPHG